MGEAYHDLLGSTKQKHQIKNRNLEFCRWKESLDQESSDMTTLLPQKLHYASKLLAAIAADKTCIATDCPTRIPSTAALTIPPLNREG